MYETEYYEENGMRHAKVIITVSAPKHDGVTSLLQKDLRAAVNRIHQQMLVYE